MSSSPGLPPCGYLGSTVRNHHQPQRGCVTSPRTAATRSGLFPLVERVTQGSSFLATLGYGPESRWDSTRAFRFACHLRQTLRRKPRHRVPVRHGGAIEHRGNHHRPWLISCPKSGVRAISKSQRDFVLQPKVVPIAGLPLGKRSEKSSTPTAVKERLATKLRELLGGISWLRDWSLQRFPTISDRGFDFIVYLPRPDGGKTELWVQCKDRHLQKHRPARLHPAQARPNVASAVKILRSLRLTTLSLPGKFPA